jgi:rhodanese-related sulfurtransferase
MKPDGPSVSAGWWVGGAVAGLTLLVALAHPRAADVELLSLSRNGILTWTNASLNVTCRVEWASSVEGPWCGSWESLANICITNQVTQRAVPMFYRVVSTLPLAPLITNVTADAALALITNRVGDTNFVILDVRTPAEYAAIHVKNATNLDYYATGFTNALAKLDRTSTYLVYCGGGSRSARAVQLMRGLGFWRVFNLAGGLGALQVLPAAAAWLEP